MNTAKSYPVPKYTHLGQKPAPETNYFGQVSLRHGSATLADGRVALLEDTFISDLGIVTRTALYSTSGIERFEPSQHSQLLVDSGIVSRAELEATGTPQLKFLTDDDGVPVVSVTIVILRVEAQD